MKAIFVAGLAWAASVLAAPTSGPDSQTSAVELPDPPKWQTHSEESALVPRQYELQETILSALLAQIQFEATLINITLRRFPEPLNPARRALAARLIAVNFERITVFINSADHALKGTRAADVLADEAARGCGSHCVSQKMNAVVREVGQASKTSLLKLGLMEVGKYIHPAFLALSGTVITVNTIVGGALVAVSALVNGLFLAVAAGVAYLGKLASDDQREAAGGPLGPRTGQIVKILLGLLKLVSRRPAGGE